MPPLLTVSKCTKRFQVSSGNRSMFTAVQNVSFDIFPGEILGLAGESGSGKTTISRLLLGLEQPDEGEIRYKGVAFTSLNREDQRQNRREIQAVFQDPLASLNPTMRVSKIVAEPLKIQGIRPTDGSDRFVKELLESVGLPNECMKKRPDQLSGGEQQRVCIARALALRPLLLIADEPVSALDAELRGGILALLREFRDKSGISILLIAHDLSLFREIANRVAIMYAGEIVEIGKTDDVLSRPRHPYTRELLQASPPYRIEDLRNNMLVRRERREVPEGNICRYLSRCPRAVECCLNEIPPERERGSGFYRCHL